MGQVPNPGLFTQGAGTSQMRNNDFWAGEGVGLGPGLCQPPCSSLGEAEGRQ